MLRQSGGPIHREESRRIWAATLCRAVLDALEVGSLRYDSKIINARVLFWLDSASEHPGSFRWICHHLDLDPDRGRSRIQYLRRLPVQDRKAYVTCLEEEIENEEIEARKLHLRMSYV